MQSCLQSVFRTRFVCRCVFLSSPGFKKHGCDDCGAEDNKRTDQKCEAEPGPRCDEPKCGTGDAKSQVEARRIGPHGKAPAVRRSTSHGLDAQAGKDQGVTEAGQGGAYRGRNGGGRQAHECEPDCLNEDANQGDLCAADPVGKVTDRQSRDDERGGVSCERQPYRRPSVARE
jgi:hypothetical protein